jgi:hypothetical protein
MVDTMLTAVAIDANKTSKSENAVQVLVDEDIPENILQTMEAAA